jgi:putative endonuclease
MYYAYILQSETTGRYYVGSTDNIERRLSQHNDPGYQGSKTTKRFKGPWVLAYNQQFVTRSVAMERERRIKSWKSSKAIAGLIEKNRHSPDEPNRD